MPRARIALLLLVLLLLAGFYVRAHHITALPVFVDEDNHIRRAAQVYTFTKHPAQESHGKFFLYLLLGFFDMGHRPTALYMARTVIALVSLLSIAMVYAVVRALGGGRFAALLSAAFYALVPYAVFFERFAFADPWAGTLGILTLWLSIRLAQKPSYHRAALVGASAAVTVAAKLTLSLAVVFPVLAFLLLGRYRLQRGDVVRVFSYLLMAGAVFTGLWLTVLVPAWISYGSQQIDDYILVNTELVEEATSADSLLTKIGDTWTKFSIMVWGGYDALGVVFVVLVLGAAVRTPRPVIFLLGCLALAWLPSILLVLNLQTRYMMSAVPLLAVLWGLGMGGNRWAAGLGALLMGAATLGLWLPFAHTLASDPPSVYVPPLDDQNYFWDRYNGYGSREALAFLALEEPQGALVFPLVKVCRQLDLHPQPDIEIECMPGYELESLAEIPWQTPVQQALEYRTVVYVLTSEQHDAPPDNTDEIGWEKLAEFAKPRRQQVVTLWRVSKD